MIADEIAAELSSVGVTHIFGVPGGGSTELVRAASQAAIPFVLSRTETGGAFMAAAQAEAFGRLGVCLTGLGPGLSSVTNGMAHALLDRQPVVVFSDSFSEPPSAIGIHQRLHHSQVVAGVSKTSVQLSVRSPRAFFASAISLATEPPPGPVHVDASGAVLSAIPVSRAESMAPATKRVDRRDAWPGRLSRLLAGARKPVLIVGLQVRSPGEVEAVRAFAYEVDIPSFVTYKAKGVIPDAAACYAGLFTNGLSEQSILHESDLILMVGVDPVELLPRQWKYEQPTVLLGAWEPEAANIAFEHVVIGDLSGLVDEARRHLGVARWRHRTAQAHHESEVRELSATTGHGMAPQRVVLTISEAAGLDDRLTVDAGAHMLPTMALWRAAHRGQVLISNGLSSMGFALPAAIGIGVATHGRVWAFTGDGGLMMSLGELTTLAKERPNVKVVVLDDERLTLIQVKQASGTPARATETGTVDWAMLGESIGIQAVNVRTQHELVRAVRAAEAPGPFLMGVKVDASHYPRILRLLRG